MPSLKIFVREKQDYDTSNNPIVWYFDTLTNRILSTAGTVSSSWIEITNFVPEILQSQKGNDAIFKISWKLNNENELSSSTYELGLGSTLTFEGTAANWVKSVFDTPEGTKLKAEVRIEVAHDSCDYEFELFEFGFNSISRNILCDECHLEIELSQTNQPLSCLEKTLLSDVITNEMVAFNGGVRFRYGIWGEKDPVSDFFNSGLLSGILTVLFTFSRIFRNIFGTGRAHVSYLVRDLVAIAIARCGYILDDSDFQADENLPNFGSGSILNSSLSPYYNLAVLFAQVMRGKNISDNGTGEPISTELFSKENTQLETVKMFLDRLAIGFNAAWIVKGNVLRFERKDYIIIDYDVFDFTVNSDFELITDCVKLDNENISSISNLVLQYDTDSTERRGEMARSKYNASYNFSTDFLIAQGAQPENEVLKVKTVTWKGFSTILHQYDVNTPDPTQYDAAIGDYIWRATNDIGVNIVSPLYAAYARNYTRNTVIFVDNKNQGNDLVVFSNDTFFNAKLILWNDSSPKDNATVFYYENVPATFGQPPHNPNYYNGMSYADLYKSESRILGVRNTAFHSPGNYNYPMSFDLRFKYNLGYYFWQIENPFTKPKQLHRFQVKLKLCCDTVDRLGLKAGQQPKLRNHFKLTNNYRAVINSIDLDFQSCEITLIGTTN